MMACMKMAVVCVVVLCSLTEVQDDLIMKTGSTSEMLVNFTRLYSATTQKTHILIITDLDSETKYS
jgi:hypothetical protein